MPLALMPLERILNYVIFELQEHYDDGYDDVHGNVQFFAMNK